MTSVFGDGQGQFRSGVCVDGARAATPAADTRISKRGSLVLIGNSCENRPGSGRILLPPDQLRQFCTNGQVSRARSAGRLPPARLARSKAGGGWGEPKTARWFFNPQK